MPTTSSEVNILSPIAGLGRWRAHLGQNSPRCGNVPTPTRSPKTKKAAQSLKESNAADQYQHDQLIKPRSGAADIEAVVAGGGTTGDKA